MLNPEKAKLCLEYILCTGVMCIGRKFYQTFCKNCDKIFNNMKGDNKEWEFII